MSWIGAVSAVRGGCCSSEYSVLGRAPRPGAALAHPGRVSTVSTEVFERICGAASSLGAEVSWRRSGGDAAGERVPAGQLYRLWQCAAVEVPGDPTALVAHVARNARIDAFGVLGFAAMTAPNGLDGLAASCRYHRLITDRGCWTLESIGGLLLATWHSDGPWSLGRHLSDLSVLAHFAVCIQQLFDRVPLREVRYRQPPPPGAEALAQLFGCPVGFSAGHDALVLDRHELARLSPPHANPAMYAFFRQRGDELLARRWERTTRSLDLVGRVCREIGAGLASGPTMTRVARELGMSERTLHRRLRQRQTSFSELVERERHRAANLLLQRAELSISEIALELGFSESSAFSRAFRRWTGRSPRAQRGL